MNILLKTIAIVLLVLLLPVGAAFAARGGGSHGGGGRAGGGGGGFHGGGGHGSGFHPSAATGYHSSSNFRGTANFRSSSNNFHANDFVRGAAQAHVPSFDRPNAGAYRGFEAGRAATFGSYNRGLDRGLGSGAAAANRGFDTVNRSNFVRDFYGANRPYAAGYRGYGNYLGAGNYYGHGYDNLFRTGWYHGYWQGNWGYGWNYAPLGWWPGYGGYWAGDGYSVVPWEWGYWPYYNPYDTGPVYDNGVTINYSQPIVLDQPAATTVVADGTQTPQQRAAPLFDAARASFAQGDYTSALAQVDQAIALVPSDTLLHEFRAQSLTALGRYKEAAAAEYAVLSAGPGWDWTTLSSLYPDVQVYTNQLRALEQYARTHPESSDSRFLLAANYLTCGHSDAAITELKAVVKLNPKDQLSSQLLAGISTPQSGTEQPGGLALATQGVLGQSLPNAPGTENTPPAKPVDASTLVGNWMAKRPDSATIKLTMTSDGKFTWEVDENGKPRQFSGTYTVADNLLVLKQGNNPMMVGQVDETADNSFNFRLAGNNPADHGLTFTR